MLVPVPNQNLPSTGSNKLIYFDCSCGNKNITKKWRYFVTDHTTSCGKCNIISADQWRKEKFGKLRMKFPINIHRNSNKKVIWICDCGNDIYANVALVTNGNTTSCGKCNVLLKSHWEQTKYGSLKMKDPIDIHKNAHTKVTWICNCGNESNIAVCNVTNQKQKTCGKCNKFNVDYWKNTKFGRLKMKDPIDVHKGSDKKVTWVCDCGNEIKALIYDITRSDGKNTRSCGNCALKIQKAYKLNQEKFLKLKPPIYPEQISDLIIALEPITHTQRVFRAICTICKNEYKPIWGNIRHGVSITCGCSTNRISGAQQEIADFIKLFGFSVELEYKIGNLKYDICVPSRRLIIEYNGLKWHSMYYSKVRDLNKYENVKYNYLMIFEDEWLFDKLKIENLLRNKLKLHNPIKLRPNNCEIRNISFYEADNFYELYHYIGKCKSPCNYGIFYQDKLIACISFKHPTRKSSYQWELARMASNPQFRVHGIWSKILKLFIKDYLPKSIVSFSDNRLFSGAVYEKMGFNFDGEIPPDYYWVKGQKRFHKSGLRKKLNEDNTKTESQLREAQGYNKIWDLGKKRWVLELQ